MYFNRYDIMTGKMPSGNHFIELEKTGNVLEFHEAVLPFSVNAINKIENSSRFPTLGNN